jgi:hypothetical protein
MVALGGNGCTPRPFPRCLRYTVASLLKLSHPFLCCCIEHPKAAIVLTVRLVAFMLGCCLLRLIVEHHSVASVSMISRYINKLHVTCRLTSLSVCLLPSDRCILLTIVALFLSSYSLRPLHPEPLHHFHYCCTKLALEVVAYLAHYCCIVLNQCGGCIETRQLLHTHTTYTVALYCVSFLVAALKGFMSHAVERTCCTRGTSGCSGCTVRTILLHYGSLVAMRLCVPALTQLRTRPFTCCIAVHSWLHITHKTCQVAIASNPYKVAAKLLSIWLHFPFVCCLTSVLVAYRDNCYDCRSSSGCILSSIVVSIPQRASPEYSCRLP